MPQPPGENVVSLLKDIKAQNEISNTKLTALESLLKSIYNALTGVTSS